MTELEQEAQQLENEHKEHMKKLQHERAFKSKAKHARMMGGHVEINYMDPWTVRITRPDGREFFIRGIDEVERLFQQVEHEMTGDVSLEDCILASALDWD